jgi:hypothetical protein
LYVDIGFGHHISYGILVVVESVRNDERKKVIACDKKKSCKFKFNCKNTLTKKLVLYHNILNDENHV